MRSSNNQEEKNTQRVEAFSDGVFAIAITLLVLDLSVPAVRDIATPAQLLSALGEEWPKYLAYVISFATILIMWMNHHKLFELIHRTDHTLLLLNGLLLLGITVVPFPTTLLAQFIQHPGAKAAAAVYSGLFIVLSVFFNALWHYAIKDGHLLREDHDRHRVRKITRQYAFGPTCYVVAFIASFLSVAVCVWICLALVIFFALPETLLSRKKRQVE